MAKAFVSYSRKDIEFARRLTEELKKSDLDFWIDWEGIPPTVDWWKEIEKGIEEADIFLFLISPDSASSKICGQEIDTAVRNGKRIIPLVVRDVKGDLVPATLSHLNWIFFRESDDFNGALQKLVTGIHTDYDWVKAHRRLQMKALEWERSNKEPSFLLRGRDLQDAEQQLAVNTSKEPHPTDLQRAYVFESRKAADRQRRTVMAIAIAGAIALAALAVFGLWQAAAATKSRNEAREASTLAVSNASTAVANELEARKQQQISRTGELATLAIIKRPNNYAQSLLLGLEVFHKMPELLSTRGIMLNNALANPQLIQYLAGHRSFVYSVAFSPDGKTLASSSDDGTILLWDVTTRQPLGSPFVSPSAPYTIVFSPQDGGHTLAAGNVDGTIIFWDVATRKPIGTPIQADKKEVNSLTYSPDGKILASAGPDGITLWDVTSRKPLGDPLTGHSDTIWKVAFSPDGKILASASADWTVILWDVETRQQIGDPLAGHNGTVWSLAFSPDGKTLATGSDDKTVILWDVASGQPLGDPLKGRSGVYSLDFSPRDGGKTLVTGNADNTITLWDMQTRQTIGQPLAGHSNWVNSVAFSPDGKLLASGSEDDTVILWDAAPRPSVEAPLVGNGPIYSISFSPDGNFFISGGGGKDLLLWDAKTHQAVGKPFTGPQSSIWAVRFSPDGKVIASGGEDTNVILWDAATHDPIGDPLTGHSGTIYSLAFSPDGKTLASGSTDGNIILWDVAKHQPVGDPLAGNHGTVWSLAFSPDGKTLAAGCNDSSVVLWDVANRKPIGEPLTGDNGAVYSIAFRPGGKVLASGGDNGTIDLWDMETLQAIGDPIGGHSAVYSLAFSPDGKTLASGTLDGSINLFDMATVEAIGQPLTGHSDWVNSLAYSPDGKQLVSGSADGTIIFWNMDPQAWVDQSCQRVGRNFTRREWTQYFPKETYRKTCEQWPLEPELEDIAAAASPAAPIPLTETPVAAPTATPIPDTYTEEFDGGMDAWSMSVITGVQKQVKAGVQDGSFKIDLGPFEDKIPWVYWLNNSFSYSNVQLEAVVTNDGNNANGISLICQHNEYGWYEFSVSSAGLYTIYAFDPNLPPIQGHIALATGGSPAIKFGKSTNTITAVCKGNQLSLYANGTLVKSVTDTLFNFPGGKIGIGASSPQRLPVSIQFDSLTVSVPK